MSCHCHCPPPAPKDPPDTSWLDELDPPSPTWAWPEFLLGALTAALAGIVVLLLLT